MLLPFGYFLPFLSESKESAWHRGPQLANSKKLMLCPSQRPLIISKVGRIVHTLQHTQFTLFSLGTHPTGKIKCQWTLLQRVQEGMLAGGREQHHVYSKVENRPAIAGDMP